MIAVSKTTIPAVFVRSALKGEVLRRYVDAIRAVQNEEAEAERAAQRAIDTWHAAAAVCEKLELRTMPPASMFYAEAVDRAEKAQEA